MWSRRFGAVVALEGAVAAWLLAACAADGAAPKFCQPGSMISCSCPGNPTVMTRCLPDGSQYQACACNGVTGLAAGTMGASSLPVAGSAVTTAPPIMMSLPATAGRFAGTAGVPAPLAGRPGGTAGTGTTMATAGKGSAGMSAMAGTGAGGAAASGIPADQVEMLRQVCVDEINRYRAMLPNLKPLKRASAAQEMCSDKGAQMDGDSMQAHGSARAGLCTSVGLGSEDTCPGWGVGGFSGNATIADALKGCLKAMWAEGEPPVSRAMCVMDYAGCFEKYGHYLNMSDPGIGSAACSFYKMKNGMYWMNQDFAR